MKKTKATKDINTLVNRSVQDIEASKKTSPIAAGQDNNPPKHNVELQDSINQVFALFRINFHNQYHAAFSDTQLVNQAKRLWLETLSHFSTQQILLAARTIIEQSEYLPTLNKMLDYCETIETDSAVPSPRKAYLEACTAPSPKAAFGWSHPLVYHAGKQTGWHLLSHEAEAISFPRFRDTYRALARQLAQGKEFPAPENLLVEKAPEPLEKDAQLKHLQDLRSNLGL